MAYYTDQIAEQERQKHLADLLALQQDNSEPGVQYDTGNQFLSALADPQNTISTKGFRPEGIMGDQYMPPQQQAPQPKNFIRNNSTGAVTSLDYAAGAPQDNRILKEWQTPKGTTMRLREGVGRDGFGRQTRQVYEEEVIPDYLNPVKLAEQKYLKGQAELQSKTPEQLGREEAAKISARDASIAARAAQPGTVEYNRIQAQTLAEQKNATKEAAALAKSDAAKRGVAGQLDTLDKAVGDVVNAPGLSSATGWFDNMTASWMSFSPNQKADARAYIKQLQNVSQVLGLQDLRKAGVAPGSITEREWPKFQAMIGNIDADLSDDEFVKQMTAIRNYVQTAKDDVGPAQDAPDSGATAAKPKLTSQDGAAMAWAMKNPNDPRAAAIKAKLGVR